MNFHRKKFCLLCRQNYALALHCCCSARELLPCSADTTVVYLLLFTVYFRNNVILFSYCKRRNVFVYKCIASSPFEAEAYNHLSLHLKNLPLYSVTILLSILSSISKLQSLYLIVSFYIYKTSILSFNYLVILYCFYITVTAFLAGSTASFILSSSYALFSIMILLYIALPTTWYIYIYIYKSLGVHKAIFKILKI
jgi:hypothetical protein